MRELSRSSGVPGTTLAAYGLPALALQATSWVVSLYLLKFATEVLWIAPALVGGILGASRIWDAVSDPLIGFASDRTRTRIGRRRPWMLAGAPLLALAFAALWTGPGEAGSSLRTAWFAVATIAYYTAYTLVSVPHASLGASLSRDANERHRIFAVRGVFQSLGLGVALFALSLLERTSSLADAARSVGLWLGLGMAALIVLGAWLTDEPNAVGRHPRGGLRSLRDVGSNAQARCVLGVLGIQELALGALLVVLPFASDYLIEAPGQTAFYLIAFVVPLTLSLPIWVRAGRKLGAYRAWRLGNAIEALGFLPLAWMGAGDQALVVIAAACIGVGHGAGRVLAMSSLAVAADEDAARTGESKEGLYFAASTFVEKCSLGVAAFGVGIALQVSGFEAGTTPPAATLSVLRALASFVPATLLGLSCALLGSGARSRWTADGVHPPRAPDAPAMIS